MTQAQDYGQDQEQGYAPQPPHDGAALMRELLEKPLYKQETVYVPFLGKEDNPVKLTPGMVLQFFAKPTKSGAICTYEQAVRFIMLCKARGLDPREGDAFLVGYDTRNGPEFNLITAHQAFLKRAEANPAYEGMESGVTVIHTETEEVQDVAGDMILEDCRLIGGWARVHRSDRKIPCYRRLDLKAYDKGISIWGSNKGGMICKCAEADALRSSFPNSLAGMYMQGEVQPTDAKPAEDARTAPPVNPAYKAAKKAGAGTVSAPAQPTAETDPAVQSPSPTAGTAAPSNVPAARGVRPQAKKETVQQAGAVGASAPAATAEGPAAAETNAAPPAARTHEPSMGVKEAEAKVQLCASCGSTMKDGACPSCGDTAPSTKMTPQEAHNAAQAMVTDLTTEQIAKGLEQTPEKYINRGKTVVKVQGDWKALDTTVQKRILFLAVKYQLIDGVLAQ
jgi:phage recombination protein Bet